MTPGRGDPDRAAIAIIGMACRFPGADEPGTFWRNLCNGIESIRIFSDEELLAAGVQPALLAEPNFVRAAPVLNDIQGFDAAFFGYSPREAVLTDPQQRIFLEVAWEAFEDAGYQPDAVPGVVGVMAGGGGVVTSYLVAHPCHPGLVGGTATLPHIGNDKDFLATRVSYKLDLTGPSLTVQTACSTSLVAVHLGCQSLLAGESDMVLAGAATVRVPQVQGYLAERGQVHSLDGHCRSFDANGQGAIFGSGVAAVVLRRLGDALDARDHVYAVIKGTSITNDGARKVSYTAPSVTGQARAMVEALTLAGVSPDTIDYVECHAAGTSVGDPLEIQALTRAFRTGTARTGFCAVGSVKSNIGHPEQTAGLAGLIKTALALEHGRIPPSLHFVIPNPNIDFASSPFFVTTAPCAWPANGHPRRAAVNSLGIGGTNAFAVLEEAPATAPSADAGRRWHVLTLSAKTGAALAAYADRVRVSLREAHEASVGDVCYTSNVSRSQFAHRLAVTGSSVPELVDKLERVGPAAGPDEPHRAPKIAFLFTGQGAQYPAMGGSLYHTHPTFREALDGCADALRPHLAFPLLDVLLTAGTGATLLDDMTYGQPALFALEYALARLWQSWGAVPAAVLGHSLGELTAACVAGTMELDEAVELVAVRGRLMQALPPGGAMVAVFASEDTVRRVLPSQDTVVVAAANGPENTVISGDRSGVDAFVKILEAQAIECKPLSLANGFHSPLVEPMLDALEAAAGRIRWAKPQVPLISNVSGRLVLDRPDPLYWRQHARAAVRFADGVRTLRTLGCNVFLEIGPGSTLLGMARQVLPDLNAAWLPSLSRQKADWQVIVESLQGLYVHGVPINWNEVHRQAQHRRVPLPTYPFQRKGFWIEPAPAATAPAPSSRATNGPQPEATLATGPDGDIRDWLYTIRWEPQPRSAEVERAAPRSMSWLVFSDAGGVGRTLSAALTRRGGHCHVVRPGRRFRRVTSRQWTVDPSQLDHFRAVIGQVAEDPYPLAGIIYLWALDAPRFEATSLRRLAIAQESFVRGALHVARTLSEARTTGSAAARIWFVTRNAQRVRENDRPTEAAQALLWGLGRTLAHEIGALWGGLIDLPVAPGRRDLAALVTELLEAGPEDQVAFRAGTRFAPRLQRLVLPANGGPSIVRPDATYLITGGLGTIGLRTARWLVEREGACSLVLVGRTGRREAHRAVIESLERRGARVHVVTADVSDERDVRRVMTTLHDLPPLRGVIHGAGVLDNELVEHLDWDRFRTVTRPKVEGSWLLHRATRDCQLDFFVVHSSLLSLTGSAGQANYTAANAFLDGLASHRRALGLPATVINWTAWDGGGLAATVGGHAQEAWRTNGWHYIRPDAGMQAFAHLMHPPVERAAIILADWPRYLGGLPKLPALYARLAGPAAPAPGDRAEPRTGPALIELVGRHVREAMGFDEPIDVRRPLSDVGLDSLMAANVAARLETALGIPVPVVKLIRGPSIERLVEELAPRLAIVTRPATAVPTGNGSVRVAHLGGTSKIAGHGWLVFPRPNPSARIRLFCFPYAGGNAATYRSWPEWLRPDIELVAVDPPGRAHRIRQRAIDDFERFMAALLPAMSPFLDRPAAFFGHCLGSVTAFEAARRLRHRGPLDLQHLFVSGARSPRRLNRHGEFEERLIGRLRRHPDFDPFAAFYDQAEDVVGEMIRQFNIGLTEDFLASAELRRLLMPAIRAEFRMGARYRFVPEPPWDTPITCFAGLDDPYVSWEDAVGWSEHTNRSFRLHRRRGAHFLVVDDRDFIVETINRELGA